jgi:hypothetical protein
VEQTLHQHNLENGGLIMTKTTKTKPLTKVQELERRISILESTIYQAYHDQDEIFAMIRVFRTYVKSDDFSKYLTDDYLSAIITNIIASQGLMMDSASLEY